MTFRIQRIGKNECELASVCSNSFGDCEDYTTILDALRRRWNIRELNGTNHPSQIPNTLELSQAWRDRLKQLALACQKRNPILSQEAGWVALDFDGSEKDIIGLCWIDARKERISWSTFDWELKTTLRAELVQHTVNRWAKPHRAE